jgi:aspartyl-tRNA(Asn)/glutamyl-tRNA(Gln) amidotransferase subunit C
MAAEPKMDRQQIEHVAKLASLSLSDEEAETLAGEVSSIVGYVAQLGELDTNDVPPTTNVELDHTSLRDDEVLPGLTHDEALAQAPKAMDNGFAVPGFVENG